MTRAPENEPEAVPARAKRDGEAPGRWLWVEPTIWTEADQRQLHFPSTTITIPVRMNSL